MAEHKTPKLNTLVDLYKLNTFLQVEILKVKCCKLFYLSRELLITIMFYCAVESFYKCICFSFKVKNTFFVILIYIKTDIKN